MMLLPRFLTCLVIFTMLVHATNGQPAPGCPQVDAGADQNLNCSTNCTQLVASSLETGATSSYKVSSVSYNPPYSFTGGTQVFINIDDEFTSTISLPFDFCFYGNQYNNCVIGTNGLISFDLSKANSKCKWQFDKPIPETTPPGDIFITGDSGIYNNSINGAFHDINPSVSSTPPSNINYQVLGSAPCRTFVVNFSTVPHFDCDSITTTQQIVLYETTNVIEVYIENKPTCSSWNYGNAVIGLQNQTGTQGITAPGRNTSSWSASQEAWRFTPEGPPNYEVNWYNDSSNLVGTGDTLNVCPSTSSSYTAETQYFRCQSDTIIVYDTVDVNLASNFSTSGTANDASCTGTCDGSISVTVNGGTPPYQFDIGSGPQSNGTFNNLCSGNYSVTVSDDANCEDTLSYYIDSSSITTVVDSTRNPSCAGDSNGLIKVSASGGTAPYTFSAANQTDSNGVFSNLTSGNYIVTITDSNNCQDSIHVNVSLPNPLTSQITVTDSIACGSSNAGSASINVSGGSGGYSYTWSNGDATSSTDSLAAGTYTVTTTDTAGCQKIDTFQINATQSLGLQKSVTDASCYGLADGSVSLTVTSGTPSYTYQWSNNANTPNLTNVSAGNYSVTVTDSSGCQDSIQASINQPNQLASQVTHTDTVTCSGPSNGTASINVSGGNGNYLYTWSNGDSTSTTDSLSAGTYTITITDSAGCQTIDTFTIASSASISIQKSVTDVTCNGFSDGSIQTTITGGTPVYTYNWSNNATTPDLNNLSAGNYSLTVTDNNGCQDTMNAIINEPPALLLNTSSEDISCNGQNDGRMIANVTSGVFPVDFSLDGTNFQQSNTFSNLSAGSYTVFARDSNGCQTSDTITIQEPPPVQIAADSVRDPLCYGGESGFASVDASGGTPGYTYQWSSNIPASGNSALSNLAAGEYSVTAIDQNNCTDSLNISLTQPPNLKVNINPSIDTSIFLGKEVQLQAKVDSQFTEIAYQWRPASGLSCQNCPEPVASPINTTKYKLEVTNLNGCIDTSSIMINIKEEKSAAFPNAFSPDEDGLNDVFKPDVTGLESIRFMIFNRWGEKIFGTNKLNEGWDGTYKGNKMPPDVYIYVAYLHYNNGDQKTLKGSVTLIR